MVGSVVRIIVGLGVVVVCATAGLPFLALEEKMSADSAVLRRAASLTLNSVGPCVDSEHRPFRTGRVLLIDGDAQDEAPDDPRIDREQGDLDADLGAASAATAETVIAVRRRVMVAKGCKVFDPVTGDPVDPSTAPGMRTIQLTVADIKTGTLIARFHIVDRGVRGAINAVVARLPVAAIPDHFMATADHSENQPPHETEQPDLRK